MCFSGYLRKWKYPRSSLLLGNNGFVVPHDVKHDVLAKAVFFLRGTPAASNQAADIGAQHGGRVI